MTAAHLGQPVEDVHGAAADDLTLWSVTTIIGALDKPALLYWAAEQTAKAAVNNQATWQAMAAEQSEADAIKWLRDARFRRTAEQLTAADLGTIAHEACEQYALTGVRPDNDQLGTLVAQAAGKGMRADSVAAEVAVLSQMLDRFDGWLAEFQPTYIATEVVVYSPTYGYAGTADGFLKIDGASFIIDYKTSREALDGRGKPKSPYPEAALQLAAYRYAEMAAVWRPRRTEKMRRRYYLLSPDEQAHAVPVPEVAGGLVISLTPGHCNAHPARCDESVHRSFLYVLEAARWQFELSKQVIAPPIEPARKAA